MRMVSASTAPAIRACKAHCMTVRILCRVSVKWAMLCENLMLHKDLTTSPEGQDKRLIAMQMVLAVRRLSAGDLTQKQPPDS